MAVSEDSKPNAIGHSNWDFVSISLFTGSTVSADRNGDRRCISWRALLVAALALRSADDDDDEDALKDHADTLTQSSAPRSKASSTETVFISFFSIAALQRRRYYQSTKPE